MAPVLGIRIIIAPRLQRRDSIRLATKVSTSSRASPQEQTRVTLLCGACPRGWRSEFKRSCRNGLHRRNRSLSPCGASKTVWLAGAGRRPGRGRRHQTHRSRLQLRASGGKADRLGGRLPYREPNHYGDHQELARSAIVRLPRSLPSLRQ